MKTNLFHSIRIISIFSCPSEETSYFWRSNYNQLLDKRERILASAYAHFSTKGYHDTTINDIAASLKMSKKTIYLVFRNKQQLFVEVGKRKLEAIVELSESIVRADKCFITKLVDYLQMLHEHVRHISIHVLRDLCNDNNMLSKILSDHINNSMLDRFSVLLQQGYTEKMIDDRVEPTMAIVMYKETLSSFLFGKPADYPIVKLEKEFHVFLSKQLRSFFRGLLSKDGTIRFDELFDNLPHLTKTYG